MAGGCMKGTQHNRALETCVHWPPCQTHLKAKVKKTFQLNIEGKNRDRVLEACKHEIRKYVKRQRRVPLPEGVDYWDFDCKFGTSAENAVVIHFATITELIDAVASEGGDSFYLELLAKTGHRAARPAGARDVEPDDRF